MRGVCRANLITNKPQEGIHPTAATFARSHNKITHEMSFMAILFFSKPIHDARNDMTPRHTSRRMRHFCAIDMS